MRIGLIGCGNMGGALVRGLASSAENSLFVHDRHPERVADAGQGGAAEVAYAATPQEAARGMDALLLAVKPGGIIDVLRDLAPLLAPNTLVVSVAAGVTLGQLEAAAPEAAIVRSMPNVGSALGAGTTAVVLGKNCVPERDEPRIQGLLGAVGEVHFAGAEDEMHGATALAGSGPAFFLTVLEAMVDGGVAAGLRREDAEVYARGAMRAASRLADQGEPPAVIRGNITSPGGTTIAGLNAMEEAGVRGALLKAVAAAVARSKTMAAG